MAPTVRRPRPALIDHLFAQPRAYTLFQAIRLVERAGAAAARASGREPPDPVGRGIDPRRAAVAIRAGVPLAFAAAEVTALNRREDGPPELTQTVIGLTGPQGVLPHVFSEIVQASIREREFGLRAFLDLFNNRAAGLLYEAWAKHRLVIERERRDLPGTRAPIDGVVAAVIGLGQPALKDRMSVPDATPAHFSGLFGQRVRSARAADQILSGALGYPIRVEQFHGTWLAMAPEDCTRLPDAARPEGAFCRLGGEAIAGARVWDVQGSVCLVVGPLDYRAFLAFLPGGPLAAYLADLAALALGPEIAVYTHLILRAEEVPPGRLGADPRATPDGRLGLNTWLGWDGVRTRPGEVELRPASPLR
ncbi:type VI secretion system baseplate subunit TssG [Methylobacterium sp. NEAU 140]|uniref:type VI secretion system baseplate subunit TssG n=1 Tax=Methylobacterium sp. NEAU 140 TaxID=3064945 RepID=UPI0027367046|nr:type VI secretion system baseplate subunit TssG [Methylobacterium sp. NEAU 140]MDP4025118.1 type VI secretion system baseplate subunit TssG [Methylobacterium sp. NEAU 140]